MKYLDNPTLVLTMAKVGTRSMLRTLGGHIESELVMGHSLNRMKEKSDRSSAIDTIKYPVQRIRTPMQEKLHGLGSGTWINDGQWFGPKANIIAGVRDPVARAISYVGFFSNKTGYKPYGVTVRDGGSVESLKKLLNTSIDAAMSDHEIIDDSLINFFCQGIRSYDSWFDEVIHAGFKESVFDYNFDFDKKCLSIEGQNRIFTYRVEDLSHSNMLSNLGRFLGISIESVPQDNKSGEGRFMSLYNAFKSQITLDEHILEWFYGSKTARFFYTPEELNAFRLRWSHK